MDNVTHSSLEKISKEKEEELINALKFLKEFDEYKNKKLSKITQTNDRSRNCEKSCVFNEMANALGKTCPAASELVKETQNADSSDNHIKSAQNKTPDKNKDKEEKTKNLFINANSAIFTINTFILDKVKEGTPNFHEKANEIYTSYVKEYEKLKEDHKNKLIYQIVPQKCSRISGNSITGDTQYQEFKDCIKENEQCKQNQSTSKPSEITSLKKVRDDFFTNTGLYFFDDDNIQKPLIDHYLTTDLRDKISFRSYLAIRTYTDAHNQTNDRYLKEGIYRVINKFMVEQSAGQKQLPRTQEMCNFLVSELNKALFELSQKKAIALDEIWRFTSIPTSVFEEIEMTRKYKNHCFMSCSKGRNAILQNKLYSGIDNYLKDTSYWTEDNKSVYSIKDKKDEKIVLICIKSINGSMAVDIKRFARQDYFWSKEILVIPGVEFDADVIPNQRFSVRKKNDTSGRIDYYIETNKIILTNPKMIGSGSNSLKKTPNPLPVLIDTSIVKAPVSHKKSSRKKSVPLTYSAIVTVSKTDSQASKIPIPVLGLSNPHIVKDPVSHEEDSQKHINLPKSLAMPSKTSTIQSNEWQTVERRGMTQKRALVSQNHAPTSILNSKPQDGYLRRSSCSSSISTADSYSERRSSKSSTSSSHIFATRKMESLSQGMSSLNSDLHSASIDIIPTSGYTAKIENKLPCDMSNNWRA